MVLISDLPVELLQDNLFPHMDVLDLMSLASTCKSFNGIMKDDTFWKRRLESDFNFTPKVTARTSGWRFIYQGMRNPRIYVWGEQSCGRLGIPNPKVSRIHDVSAPVQLRIPNARVVNLVAGGMSFHALDSEGNVHVWGAMDGTSMALQSDGYSEPSKQAPRPLRLRLPHPTRAISCGRLHAATLDSTNQIWNLLSWGRPFKLASPLLDGASAAHTPQQIECGWSFTSALTKTADVLVWFPFGGGMAEKIMDRFREMDGQGDARAAVTKDGKEIPCKTWELAMDPVTLPPIPDSLPKLEHQDGVEEDGEDAENRLVHIAGGDNYLVGLTNHGHVLKFGPLRDEASVIRGEWIYLPNFSEVEKVANLPTFKDGDAPSPMSLKITHVSAHFNTFTAYSTGSTSIVLFGDGDTSPTSAPTAHPSLQHKFVISVVLGDYHHGALTSSGDLYTWGQYSHGALGLGDPTHLPPGAPGGFESEQHRLRAVDRGFGRPGDVGVPSLVKFGGGKGKGKEREGEGKDGKGMFCFSACASGWHTGALVIPLEQNESGLQDSDEEPPESEDEVEPPRTDVPALPNILRGRAGFRIGYAGRGANRGGMGIGHHPGQQQDNGEGSGAGRGTGIFAGYNPLSYFRVGFPGRGGGGA